MGHLVHPHQKSVQDTEVCASLKAASFPLALSLRMRAHKFKYNNSLSPKDTLCFHVLRAVESVHRSKYKGQLPRLCHSHAGGTHYHAFCISIWFWRFLLPCLGFPGGSVVQNLPANAGHVGAIPGPERSPGEGNGNPLQYSLGESQRQRSLAGYGPWGHKESDTTEQLNNNFLAYTSSYSKKSLLKSAVGLPWWLSGEESACQFRRHRFDPWSERIPHAPQLLSLGSAARKLQLLKPTCPRAGAPQQEKPQQKEVCVPHLESSPCSLQPEGRKQKQKPWIAMKTQHSQK